ncbi:MAG: RNA helicase [Candidatus Schekmanbacteria bacterium RBG_13_48_7]|uniref:RNA helicase n=1 Tax=Candidatus Schekmanbacteria bacterium RBG_13_48_7 TaxID=1817878 RepID=A0A1F7RLP5_9BACT|nr:MAG: RNA helicase [Candidatus Schekmanbacteria bacterium RBG_13_48_7]
MNFERFNLFSEIKAGVKSLGFTTATPVQEQSIPIILEGRDLMGLAQTGTGKTAAFVLPILQRLMQGPRRHIRALIIAPTRELTEQTREAIEQLGRKTGVHSMSIYGGVSIQPQINALRRGVDIVAACPGRLLDHICRRTIDLSQIEVLVLDEADRLFDMGFLPDIRKIVKRLPVNRQTLMFSATMPDAVSYLADEILHDPAKVQIDHNLPAATVSHTFYSVETHLKNDLLKQLLEKTTTGPVLVFTRTKLRSDRIAQQLARFGFKAAALHGNLSQNKRQQALNGFRSGKYKILVATDVAARGIDVPGVSHVINYDIPETADAYTHRIGRTGRACETGDALTFVTVQDFGPARSIRAVLGDKLKNYTMDGCDPASAVCGGQLPGRLIKPRTIKNTGDFSKRRINHRTKFYTSRKPRRQLSIH